MSRRAERAGPDDRCPGALRVHPAADGGLVRVRVPGGAIDTARWRALAAAARRHAAGTLELTGRGNVQLRGVRPGAEPALAADLAAAGLLPAPAHDRVRNVVASPLSGRAGPGLLDVRPLVRALDAGLCADPDLARLPGRFLFALDDGRRDVLPLRADAALLGAPGGVALWLGGTDAGLRVPAPAGPAALLAAATAFLAERAARGSTAWRIAELPDGPAAIAARVAATLTDPVPGTPLDGPPGGDSAGDGGDGRIADPSGPGGRGPVGPVAQRDGRTAVGVVAPLGRLTAAQVDALADRAAGELVVTPWRSVVLPDLADAPAALRALAAAGLVTDPRSPWVGVTACAGTGCASALADVHADARAVHGRHGLAGPAHWSGCDRRCGQPAGTAVRITAGPAGYGYEGDPATTARIATLLDR
ncbi:precorrin-3B synthase [Pilimelia anulata]|uniref:Precorrin-3B synthase n=1 Tax=Pilimelia anulata TaxID=53371 RepID=A0A8J3B2C2_9ACTN|nr:precorrin-3B synthase [Pilimelia anulata]GGJ90827.1 precorrin-3B synthase [Pilimelia anulata]